MKKIKVFDDLLAMVLISLIVISPIILLKGLGWKNEGNENYAQNETTTDLAPTIIINPAEYKDKEHKVTNVVDGDTIDIDMNGKTQRIRFIGVDTPETVNPNKSKECYGDEASAYTKEKLLDKNVIIEMDDSQGTYDSYGRLLAYVYLDGYNFNLDLLVNGYAYEYNFNTPYSYRNTFLEGQTFAKEHDSGLWAYETCNGKR